MFFGERIQPGDEKAMENLARYIVRASFSQERMAYIREESKVVYQSKDGKSEKVFDALEWLGWRPCVPMCSIRASRWSGIMAITPTWLAGNGKKQRRMI